MTLVKILQVPFVQKLTHFCVTCMHATFFEVKSELLA